MLRPATEAKVARTHEATPEAAVRPVPVQTRVATPPVTPPEPERAIPPLAEAAGPTIRVTIGRVEVRALTPPAPRAKPTPAPEQQPALETYLEQRARGRRR